MIGTRSLLTMLLSSAALLGGAQAAFAQDGSATVEEVVITASKTGENVREIAGSVSAITGAQLSAIGAQSAEDYLTRTPGVVFNVIQPGFSTVTIRGVNTNTGFGSLSQGTTGIYINDIPLTDPFFSAGTPDIDTFDVDHIEVYRGPQGTLFGSASMGGAVNYVAQTPNLSAMQMGAETFQSWTEGADEMNSSYRVMLNAPILDGKFAIRLTGAYRSDAGYVDNTGTGKEDANDTTIAGGRFQAAWQPFDGTKLTWLSLYQKIDSADAGYVNPDIGDLKKDPKMPEPSENTIVINSLRLEQDLPFGTLTAIASRHRKVSTALLDAKQFELFGFDSPAADENIRVKGESYEVRLAGEKGRPLQWLVGAMYAKNEESIVENIIANNSGAVADAIFGPGAAAALTDGDSWGITRGELSAKEMAVFGEASYTFAERLKVTLGGRLFKTETGQDTYGFGLLYAAFINGQVVNDPPPVSQKEDGFNPKAAISFDIRPGAQVYALASKGYRFGGTNVNPDPLLPTSYQSDSLWNYEVGLKSEWLDRRLIVDASLFRINWSDIQLTIITPQGTAGLVNAGDAEINGAELSASWRSGGFTANTSVTYLDAALSSVTNPLAGVSPGTKLPAASEWQVASTVRYQFDTPYDPYVSLSHRFASETAGYLQQFAARDPKVGGYNIFDLRAGMTLGEVQLAAYVNNLTDERAVLSDSYNALGDDLKYYINRPRTVGVSISWKR
jgi:iron complex outermembrane receptor protein